MKIRIQVSKDYQVFEVERDIMPFEINGDEHEYLEIASDKLIDFANSQLNILVSRQKSTSAVSKPFTSQVMTNHLDDLMNTPNAKFANGKDMKTKDGKHVPQGLLDLVKQELKTQGKLVGLINYEEILNMVKGING